MEIDNFSLPPWFILDDSVKTNRIVCAADAHIFFLAGQPTLLRPELPGASGWTEVAMMAWFSPFKLALSSWPMHWTQGFILGFPHSHEHGGLSVFLSHN